MIAKRKTTKARAAEKPLEKTKSRQPLPKASPASSPAVAAGAKPLTIEIDIASIDAGPFNPRTEFDQAEIDSLAASLNDHGLLQPIVVRATANGRYELIAGGRRLKAAIAAGWKVVPATVRNATDEDALTWALVENLERADLNPVDQARGVARLCAPKGNGGCGMTLVEAGEVMGRDTSWIRFQIQMLRLPEVWLGRIASGQIRTTMSKALIPYVDRPAVLARIEADMLASPWAWRTSDDFERNAKFIAEGDDARQQRAVAAELLPMRARPGETEDPDNIRRRDRRINAAASTHADDDSDDTDSDGDAGQSPAAELDGDDVAAVAELDPATPAPMAAHVTGEMEGLAGLSKSRVDVATIIELIGLVDDVAALDEIALAVDARRRQIGD